MCFGIKYISGFETKTTISMYRLVKHWIGIMYLKKVFESIFRVIKVLVFISKSVFLSKKVIIKQQVIEWIFFNRYIQYIFIIGFILPNSICC